jgi:hypothetical protein
MSCIHVTLVKVSKSHRARFRGIVKHKACDESTLPWLPWWPEATRTDVGKVP